MQPTVIKIYPRSWADLLKERAGQPYQPSNGTEGEFFLESWCSNCARDAAMNEGLPLDECDDNQVCDIIARTFTYRPADAEYPKEWIYDQDGMPCCTAYTPSGEPIPTTPCAHTLPLDFEPPEDRHDD